MQELIPNLGGSLDGGAALGPSIPATGCMLLKYASNEAEAL